MSLITLAFLCVLNISGEKRCASASAGRRDLYSQEMRRLTAKQERLQVVEDPWRIFISTATGSALRLERFGDSQPQGDHDQRYFPRGGHAHR